jgi:hypothetical protein
MRQRPGFGKGKPPNDEAGALDFPQMALENPKSET